MKKNVVKIPKRPRDSHKKNYGHVLVIAGSRGLTGAAYLTSQAALLSGSGLVTLAIPESLNSIMEIKLTEVMTVPLPETKDLTLAMKSEEHILELAKQSDVIAMGPGLSLNKETQRLLRSLLRKLTVPVVLDADGITALAGHEDILQKRRQVTVLTPHPGEMSRLIDKNTEYVQKNRENIAKSFSIKYNCVTILKGYRTIIANTRGNTYTNDTGNSGMSTAGVGDILTGMIASLIGQGINYYSSSILGVYLHGLAGDIAAREKSQFSMIASDILDRLHQVFKGVA